jgi:GLPGLI family protein
MKMYRLLCLMLLSLSGATVHAQLMEGVIVYEEVTYWNRLTERLDFLSQEEKDRMTLTWKNYDEYKVNKKLVFDGKASLYMFESNQTTSSDGRYSSKNPVYSLFRDFQKNIQSDYVESLGRVYHIEDSLRTPNWKIMNQIKDILGHVCMMAVAEDTVRGQKITAWFADDLPVPVGPGAYFGLPGAILELSVNDGDVVATATKIELRNVNQEIQASKKLKGRKLTLAGYDELISKHIADSKKARRNPYWSMPIL